MRFEPNRPFETSRSTVLVDAGLPPGRHRFRLQVVDARGRKSRPADVVVMVVRRQPLVRPDSAPTPGSPG